MKIIWVFLVALALFSRRGGSIVCYYCPDETLSSECTEQRNCSSSSNVCKTTVLSPDVGFPFQGNEVVIRGCSSSTSCIADDPDSLGDSKIIFCCNTDLCNNRGINATIPDGAAHISVATGAILLGISVLLMITWL
ncbi:secreted Ly-6/uPAR-related protein 1-like [Hyla sarda]|uniref:secreted Ly-6/uPAR-related protein 1-like n=1 Tax=Hyla sarda TaxID=327740 RepID=UPI0024C29559|nr:secreted Ly-6/uPAR-related protein 1-like [Hyla sarda]